VWAARLPLLQSFVLTEEAKRRRSHGKSQMERAGIGADVEAATLQERGKARDGEAVKTKKAGVIDSGAKGFEAFPFARFGASGGDEREGGANFEKGSRQGAPAFERPLLFRAAGVDGEMDGLRRNRGVRPFKRVVGRLEIETRGFKRAAARREDLAALLEDRQIAILARDPVADEPAVPEMVAPGGVGGTMRRSGERGEKNGSISAAEIIGDIKPLATQFANQSPMAPPGRAFGRQWKGPRAGDAGRELEDFGADWSGEGMDLGAGIIAAQFPERRDEVDGVAEEAKVNHNNFAGALRAPQKVGRWPGCHAELLQQPTLGDDEKQAAHFLMRDRRRGGAPRRQVS